MHIKEIIWESIEEINQMLAPDQRLARSEDLVLTGNQCGLDSLGLINLIVAIEEKIQHKLGLTITLANVQVMTQEINPFSNVNTLADYIAQLLKEKKHE